MCIVVNWLALFDVHEQTVFITVAIDALYAMVTSYFDPFDIVIIRNAAA